MNDKRTDPDGGFSDGGLTDAAPPTDGEERTSRWLDDPQWQPTWPDDFAKQAGTTWKAAHHKLIAQLRSECAAYVNHVLHRLRNELGQPHNGWSFDRIKGPSSLADRAETKLKELHGSARANREAFEQLQRADTLPDEPAVEPSSQDWWKLSAITGVMVAVESVANSFLLASALTTGLLGAFITAIVVSVLNVGAMGVGVGLLLAAVRRRFPATALFAACLVAWGGVAVFFNLLVGRHREAFALLIEAREEQIPGGVETSMSTATDMLSAIPYSPATWQFESLLFFLLGIALCAFGLYKGYTFKKVADPAAARRQRFEALEQRREAIWREYSELAKDYRHRLTHDLRKRVAGWIEGLATELSHATDRIEDIRLKWAGGSFLADVEARFVTAYNNAHATKIDGKKLEQHRDEAKIDLAFPAAASDMEVLESIREVIHEWKTAQMHAFFDDIETHARRIEQHWTNYDPMIREQVRSV